MEVSDDIVQTDEVKSTICPYSQKEMENPVKNKICGHTFEKNPIIKYIRSKRDKAKCPAAGK